jgi:hypothetical protein
MFPLLLCALLQHRHRRARDIISSKLTIQIKHNTLLRRRVETRRRHAARQLDCPAPFDLNINTLRITLRAVRLARSMERDDFVAENVVARREVGDGEVPCEA